LLGVAPKENHIALHSRILHPAKNFKKILPYCGKDNERFGSTLKM